MSDNLQPIRGEWMVNYTSMQTSTYFLVVVLVGCAYEQKVELMVETFFMWLKSTRNVLNMFFTLEK